MSSVASVLISTLLAVMLGQEQPAAPPVSPAQAPRPVRIGGTVKPPQQTKRVPPVYPRAPMRAGVHGVVILEGIIDVDGRVRPDVTVLRSVPFLDDAAIDAVRQWEYTPTLLDGAPVAVIMTITVTFSLEQPPGAPPRPPLIDTAWPAAAGALRVGRDVKAPAQIKSVGAVYPAGAPAALARGGAILELLIGVDDKVKDARSLLPTPPFDESAIEAAKQWEYEPTMVNGAAVSVVMPVIVTSSIK